MGNSWIHTMDESGETPFGRGRESGHWLISDILLKVENGTRILGTVYLIQ